MGPRRASITPTDAKEEADVHVRAILVSEEEIKPTGPSNTLLFCRPLKKPRVTHALRAAHCWL